METEARYFLETLFAAKREGHFILLWTLPEKLSRWFENVPDAIQYAGSLPNHDLYVGIGLSSRDYGAHRRCPSVEVAGIVGVWADIDLQSDAHPKGALPATVEEALDLLPKQLPPTFLVRTGNGLHAWWLFREPWIFESDEGRRDAANLVFRWQSLLRLIAAARGWNFDRLADLARVLRIPGTTNCKDPQNPKPVSIYSQSDRRYNPSDFIEVLEDNAVPDTEKHEPVTPAWKVTLEEQPLSIDPSATVPADLLNRYMATDPRFKSTWLRQREDLKDQSQSGYDLALANFGFAAGLSEQQIVELIIHHRRIHGQRPRTKLDYYQRTIATALTRNENIVPTNSLNVPEGEASQPLPHPRPDAAMARALLCEQISKIIGVRVLRIVKIDGQEPTYRMELETTQIAFDSVGKLVGQQSFRLKIASAVQHMPPRLSPKLWDQVAQMMLNALTVEDGGDEANLVGAARVCVEGYLAETPFIDAQESQPYQTKYKPAVNEGQIAICARDLLEHINKTNGENGAIKEVTAMLSALGASSTRLKRTCLRDQSRWLLPSSHFAPDASSGVDGEGIDAKSS